MMFENRRAGLSTIWIFLTVNFLYADVVALFDPSRSVHLGQAALLGASFLVEVPMAMIVLSYLLPFKANRWSNIAVGAAYTLVTLVTQFALPLTNGTATAYYEFFGAVEILATGFVVWYAWTWTDSGRQSVYSGGASPNPTDQPVLPGSR